MPDETPNGRVTVTMAVLGERLDNAIDRIKANATNVELIKDRLDVIISLQAELIAVRNEVNDLRRRSDRWDAFIAFVTGISIVIGFLTR